MTASVAIAIPTALLELSARGEGGEDRRPEAWVEAEEEEEWTNSLLERPSSGSLALTLA